LLDALDVDLSIRMSRVQVAGSPKSVKFFQANVLLWPRQFFWIARNILEQSFSLFSHPIYAWAI
jgi:hypothetical protein